MIRLVNGHKVNIKFCESIELSREKRKKNLLNSLNRKDYFCSFSHSKNISVCAYIPPSKNIGIDIEPIERQISIRLNQILSLQSKRLKLKNIELWCLMEATFKACPDLQHQHFLNYDFERDGKLFWLKHESNKRIFLKIFKRKKFVYAIAIED